MTHIAIDRLELANCVLERIQLILGALDFEAKSFGRLLDFHELVSFIVSDQVVYVAHL
jgi:hypothetical protein